MSWKDRAERLKATAVEHARHVTNSERVAELREVAQNVDVDALKDAAISSTKVKNRRGEVKLWRVARAVAQPVPTAKNVTKGVGGELVRQWRTQAATTQNDPRNALLWDWVHSLFYFYGAMAPRPLHALTHSLLGALEPARVGPLLNADGTPHAFANLPGYQAHSSDFALDAAGWQIVLVGVESTDGTASALLWWITGSGDEAARFHTHFNRVDAPGALRHVGGLPLVVIEGGVAERSYDLDAAFSRRGQLPAIRNHELGRCLAAWPIMPIAV